MPFPAFASEHRLAIKNTILSCICGHHDPSPSLPLVSNAISRIHTPCAKMRSTEPFIGVAYRESQASLRGETARHSFDFGGSSVHSCGIIRGKSFRPCCAAAGKPITINVNTIENRNIGSDNAPSSHFDPASDGLLRMRNPTSVPARLARLMPGTGSVGRDNHSHLLCAPKPNCLKVTRIGDEERSPCQQSPVVSAMTRCRSGE